MPIEDNPARLSLPLESEMERVEGLGLNGISSNRTMSLVRADQARLRIREEMERKKLVQREVAELLEWSQSRLAKVLTGRVALNVDDLESLCFAVGITMVEVLRDRGMEFMAEMTPSELRMLERMRQLPRPVADAIATLLDVNTNTREHQRRAAGPPPKPRGPRNK